MVAYPYTKRMVANPDVEMSAGCLVASVQWARDRGVPSDRWVFVHAGTDGSDPYLSQRRSFTRSPAIEIAGGRALALASISPDDLAYVDLYSCFPSAVQIAQRELRLTDRRDLTVYGGLSFAGGPWNNPVSHAVAAMVDRLRSDAGSTGLVTANGGNLQKHSFGVYSTEPPGSLFRYERPQSGIDARGVRPTSRDYEGEVQIESWTVIHRRNGDVDRAHASTLTADGTRVWGVIRDGATARQLEGMDVAGALARVDAAGNLELQN
jgi:acetyl-CoA C-acetyltransferase